MFMYSLMPFCHGSALRLAQETCCFFRTSVTGRRRTQLFVSCEITYGADRRSSRRCWRVRSQPETFPYKFRHFCESCGAGSGMIWCSVCDGEGYYLTEIAPTCTLKRVQAHIDLHSLQIPDSRYLQPGKAGHPYKQGMARCKTCSGIGVVPCPLCGGQEIKLRQPDPENGPPRKSSDISIYDWLGQFGQRLPDL